MTQPDQSPSSRRPDLEVSEVTGSGASDWPEPCQSMTDLSGWAEVTCQTREQFFGQYGDRLKPYSSLTDPDGQYGPGVIYTEWGSAGLREKPWLRDYRWTDRGCVHYMPAAQIGWPTETATSSLTSDGGLS